MFLLCNKSSRSIVNECDIAGEAGDAAKCAMRAASDVVEARLSGISGNESK